MINKEKFNLSSGILFQSEEDIFIEVDWSRLIQDTQVIVKVKDTATPTDPDILPQLFSTFASKSFEVTGLGLFISKSIIEAHGGKIWGGNNFNFNGGMGATFYFTLPLIK